MRVISASRRIDMVAGYPEELARTLEEKAPPSETHSLVLWTKNPINLFEHPSLRKAIDNYEQLLIHYTITGMGGTFLEPRVLPMEEALGLLPRVFARVDSLPERLRLRFDPIVHIRSKGGQVYTNLSHFEVIARAGAELGIRDISVSWMESYTKVRLRLGKKELEPVSLSQAQWEDEREWLFGEAKALGLRVHGCCVKGLPISRCIDGELLSRLHPRGEKASTLKAKGQRPTCGCTESLDIGWYKPCPHGCLYCYGNPRVY